MKESYELFSNKTYFKYHNKLILVTKTLHIQHALSQPSKLRIKKYNETGMKQTFKSQCIQDKNPVRRNTNAMRTF